MNCPSDYQLHPSSVTFHCLSKINHRPMYSNPDDGFIEMTTPNTLSSLCVKQPFVF